MLKIAPKVVWIAIIIASCSDFSIFAAVEEIKKPVESVYLFSYFKNNGEDGLHLAYSHNGLEWKALKKDTSYLKPQVGGKLMRDPSICRGPDGVFHMVWTTGWWDKGIGIAHSRDLIHWSEQTFLAVMKHEPHAKNCWAPEVFYDEATKKYIIFWATTIPSRFPETENLKDDNNHRIYCVTTEDFKTFSDTHLFYDPGFNVIDAFIVRDCDNNRYVMFLKNETKHPVTQKNIRVAFSEKAEGPYGPASEPITGDYWAEGPSAIKIAGQWIIYFDKYTKGRYGAMESVDFKDWTDISNQVEFPQGTRHGTVFRVSQDIFDNLIKFSIGVTEIR